MDGLETTIVNIDEGALDELFDETPDKTVNADTLIGGKKPSSKAEGGNEDNIDDDDELSEEDNSKKQSKKKAVPKQPKQNTIEDFSDDDLRDEDETDEDEEDGSDEDDENGKQKKGTKRSEKSTEGNDEGSKEAVQAVLKNTVDFLIQQGAWDDFDGREELELTEENYAQLVLAQDRRRVQGMFEEMVDSTGPYGKAIIDFVKNGGNADEIIDLFKEQKRLDSINVDSTDGQKDLIKHYYTEVMDWKPERAEKYINNLVLSNELESEAQEVKELFSSYYQKEVTRLNKDREDFIQRQKEAEQAFETNIRTAIKDRKDLSPSEKRLVEDQLLRYDQKLPNGNLVNKFYVNFARMQANPQDYIELVMFVNDKQKYNERVAIKEKSKAASEAFKFIKGNGAVSSKKGTGYDEIRKNDKVSGFDWGLPSSK